MLCYRCGSHVPDSAETCSNCGQRLDVGGRMPGATSMRRRPGAAELLGAPFKAGDTIGGRYEVRDSVGTGPLGFVLRCQDRELETEVALKLVHPRLAQSPEERAHFVQVMKGGHKFGHPSLARVYDEGVLEQGWLFYTQPFLDGFTLRKIIDLKLAKGQLFTLREVLPVLSQLTAALDATRAQGAHGNLKPSNIVLQPDLLKITDHGLALALPRRPFVQAQKPNLAHRYLAPEYVAGFEVDGRADQYSLGVMVGEMLAGVFPEGTTLPSLRSKNPDLDAAVEGFYRKALSERSDGRFPSGSEMLEEFKGLGGSLFAATRTRAEPQAPPEPVSDSAPRFDTHDERTDLEERRALELREERRRAAAASRHEAPPDATQPISAEELARHLSGKHPAVPPEDESSLPGGMSPPPFPSGLPSSLGAGAPPLSPSEDVVLDALTPVPTGPPPAFSHPPGEFPTQSMQSILAEPSVPSQPGGLFAASRRSSLWEQPGVKLGVLCFAGLVLGALGGWWFLSRIEKPAAPASISLSPEPPLTSGKPGASPAPPAPALPSAPHPAAGFPRVVPPSTPPARR